ncbi:class I SAM-dependent methyltransferase [Crenothrix polyspora]|uniref:Methyltransferase type 11 n=1 Tax=Crenothrix polyspora TaxID=360316 RepID=A0A1R4HAQ4_9GAMM|nr:class I SAM-dependent methyltransferase [Crenothrix polyspora]SJM93325.1 Methyltransferase type 11 [Crenothrix polyspora]
MTLAEHYSGGYSPLIIDQFKQRSFARHGVFVQPYLTAGLSVLDCGCGPGSITLDIAELVNPGVVHGIDFSALQIEQALLLQKQRAITNARFTTGSAYQLPYDDAQFDVVFAHAVLYHLQQPQQALAEFRRVLKPGGVVALRDACHTGDIMQPWDVNLAVVWQTIAQVFSYQGGNIYFGSQHKQLLLEQGFQAIVLSCSYDMFATDAEKHSIRDYWHQFLDVDHRSLIVEQQWLTALELTQQCAALDQWLANPASFFARARCEAIARK